ncbi:MAG: hypothetical protein AB1861_29415 [Cyanobacteriota bacterium]
MKEFFLNNRCVQIAHLNESESIQVYVSSNGGYYFLQVNPCGVITDSFLYATGLEALTAAVLDRNCDEIDRLKRPAAIFSLETGKILHANPSHYKWLGHGATRMHFSEVLSRVVSPERVVSKILSAGTRTVGMYEIFASNSPFSANETIWESFTKFCGFIEYEPEYQRILDRWLKSGDTPELYSYFLQKIQALSKHT